MFFRLCRKIVDVWGFKYSQQNYTYIWISILCPGNQHFHDSTGIIKIISSNDCIGALYKTFLMTEIRWIKNGK